MPEYEEVSFKKEGHFYRFRWTPGDENRVFEKLYGLADDPEFNMNSIDVAIIAGVVNLRAREREITGE